MPRVSGGGSQKYIPHYSQALFMQESFSSSVAEFFTVTFCPSFSAFMIPLHY